MAIFTTSEANASKIVRMESFKQDGTHKYWIFGITCADGNYIDWTDSTLSSSATKAEIKARILEYVTGAGDYDGIEKQAAKPVNTVESIADKGIGETIG
tara:strand:- start:681 stop:977 length:297 start_codon:yes stop_codon:yes gene_type:complete